MLDLWQTIPIVIMAVCRDQTVPAFTDKIQQKAVQEFKSKSSQL